MLVHIDDEIIVSGATIGHPAWISNIGVVIPLIEYTPENFPDIVVSSGMRYVDTTVNYTGRLTVSTFGMAENTTIAILGNMHVSSNGLADSTSIDLSGALRVFSGGIANNTKVLSGGSLFISSGGVVNSTIISSCGNMWIFSGGTANNNTVASGRMGLREGGRMFVCEGGTANNNKVQRYGTLHVSSGGTATNNIIQGFGELHVSSGGTATNITASASARLFLTLAPNTYIAGTSDGSAFVFNGKSLSDYTVVCGGELYVASGCTATNIDCAPWEGHVFIEDGATVTFASSYSGVFYYAVGEGEMISSAMSMESMTIESGDEINVMSGGVLNGVTVKSGCGLYVSSGGTATDANVFADARLMITSDGMVNNTRIGCIGYVIVSGGTATNNQINGGNLSVSCGGLADSTTIAGGNETHPGYIVLDITKGVLDVCSGGTATNTTVTKDGRMTVYAGGTADSVAVETDGIISVSGGTVTGLTLADGAGYDFTVVSGTEIVGISGGSAFEIRDGIVSGYAVNDRGTLQISSDGTATGITIGSGGSIIVSSGGTAAENKISAGGALAIFSGGTAAGNRIESDGTMYVYDGGTATLTTINRGGGMTLFFDGAATETTIISGGTMNVSSGGTANSTTVSSGGKLFILFGGTADSTTVVDSGKIFVDSGGTANNTKVDEGGYVYVENGGTANNNSVNAFGTMFISSGGTAENTTVRKDGEIYVENGGFVNSTTVYSSGELLISSGGTADNTIVNDWGYFLVKSGGTAKNTIVNPNGLLYVFSGGTATDVVWTPCEGFVMVKDGGTATFVSEYSGVYYGSDTQLLSHEITMDDKVVGGDCEMRVMSGGTANNTIVNGTEIDCTGLFFVQSGGTANGTIVDLLGFAFVSNGGTANSTTVNWNGSLSILSGGVANWTTINSFGAACVSRGGTANNTMLVHLGFLDIYSGAVINDTAVIRESFLTISGGTANNTTVELQGQFEVSSGGVANSTAVISGGTFYVSSGGTANSTTVSSSGKIGVSSGGTATGIVADSGARLSFDVALDTYIQGTYADSSFEIKDAFVSGYTVDTTVDISVLSGGTANNTKVNSGGWLGVFSGGTATGIVADSGAKLSFDVASGTYIQGTYADSSFEMKDAFISGYAVDNGGRIAVISGGTADSTTVNNGIIAVSRGGTMESTTVNNGSVYVSHGGMADSTTVNGGGILVLGGTVNSTTINRANFSVDSGGTANITTVNGGRFGVYSNATANSTTLNSGSMFVYAGGTANITTVNGGRMCLYEESTANRTTVNSGGSLSAISAIASDVMIESGGALTMSSGRLTGKIMVEDGGIVSMTETDLDFDISRMAPGMSPLVNDLSKLQAGSFSFTVSDMPWNGAYQLSEGAGGFDGQFSMKNLSGKTLGLLEVDKTVNVNGVEYTLSLSDDTLSVTVTGGRDLPAIPVTADITAPTNQVVTVTAGFGDASVIQEYSYDNETWLAYTEPLSFEENGIVYFLGRDQKGFVTEAANYEVTNIDTTAPVITLSGDNTTPLQASTLTASVDDGSVIFFFAENKTWVRYEEPLTVTANATYYFKSTDAAGNTGTAEYTFRNIDTTAPVIILSGDNTTPLRASTLTALADDGSLLFYSTDNETWTRYKTRIRVTANATYYFKATDAAGNTGTAEYTFANIDTTPPEEPIAFADVTTATNSDVFVSAKFSEDSVAKEYSLDGTTWQAYTEPVKFTENGSVSFRGIDAVGNVSEVASYTVENIDKVAPVKPTVSADITTPTNTDVTVSAVFSEDSVVKEYSLDGTIWQMYTEPVKFTENGSVMFHGIDAAGNVSEAMTFTVENIDKVAPVKPTVSADITTPTNTDVTVSAVFSEDSVKQEYSMDGQTWKAYTTGILFTQNGSVSFRGTDAAGNVSEIASYTVENINKVAPDKPIATVDVTTPTNSSVHVSAIFNEQSVANEYSLNGTDWFAYIGSIELDENGTVYFRSTDEAGNISEVTGFTVDNIDKVAPVAPITSADVMTATNGNVLVSAVFSEDSAVKEYSLDGGETWKAYTEAVKFTENGSVSFRGTDAAGNVSEVASYTVENIDKVAPEKPTASADITAPTNTDVLVSAEFSEDSVVKEYSLDGGETWKACTEAIKFTENGSVSFRGIDAAGNISEVASYTVDNIDKVAPIAPVASADVTAATNGDVLVSAVFSEDSAVKEYSLDRGETWQAYTDAVKFTGNGDVSFRSTDAAGNVSEVTDFLVNNIDKAAPVITLTGDNQTPLQQATLTATVDDGSPIYYRINDSGDWTEYKEPITVTENATYNFLSTDAAGNEGTNFLTFDNIDTTAPEAPIASANITSPTNSDVTVSAVFSDDSVAREYSLDGGETWQAYDEGGVIIIINGTVLFRGTDEAGNISEIASYTVDNIDKVAPVAPAELQAVVSERTVTLSWGASTDDLAGVKEYIVTYSHNGQEFTTTTAETSFVLEDADPATWQWSVKAVDNVGNVSSVTDGEAFTVVESVEPEPEKKFAANSDIDGNGISDVMFVWTGNNYQHGYWMNGTSEWQSAGSNHPAEWENLGCYDMTGDGKADSVLVGNVEVGGVKGAYIGYYADANDLPDGSTWVNIGYLTNADDIVWKNAVGNLTGGAANSIVWYAPELYALGAWTDGTDSWMGISNKFGGDDWTLIGCGDFDGDGKDSVLMTYNGGQMFYAVGIGGAEPRKMGSANWSGWDVRAIGDFSGDGKDDLVLFHKDSGSMVMFADGNADDYTSIGQLDASDWFVVGAGDYNADGKDDLLVRQYTTGMLGYYDAGDVANGWVELGRGVDMNWTVIA